MKKRPLQMVLILLTCLLFIGTACGVTNQNHGYSTANNQKNEELLEEISSDNLSTTQTPKEEEVTKTTTKTSLRENVAVTSQTQTNKVQDTKVFSSLENTPETQTTSEGEDRTSVIVTATTTEIDPHTIIVDKPIEISEVSKTTIKATTAVTTTTKATTAVTKTATKVTTTTILSTEETAIQTESAIAKLNDCIIIGNNVIPIAYGPATQDMVDKYEVVQDTELWSDERNKYFFGHNMRSFSCLFKVELGDIITLVNDGIETKYKVFRCERGTLTEDGFNIKSSVDGTYLINKDFGCETVRMITCFPVFNPPDYRLVVIGEKIE